MEQFRKTFDLCMQKIDQASQEFTWEEKQSYAQWLRDSYEYAFNSTRILAQAAAIMPRHCTQLSNRFISHAAEEKGHEKLLENDLKALGYRVEDLEPSQEMKLFYQSLYYWLSPHGNVMGIFGWVFALEGAAVKSGEYAYEKTKEAHGAKASTFLKVHSAEDPDHLEKAFRVIAALPKNEQELIEKSLLQYTNQYVAILKSAEIKNNVISMRAVA